MLVSRRRRGRFAEADRRLRASLGDANLLAWYDCRFPWTIAHTSNAVSSWGDARGASGYAPALVQATSDAKPTYSATAGITFDGTSDFLRDTTAFWNAVTSDAAIALVWTPPAGTSGGARHVAELSVGTGNVALSARIVASSNTGQAQRTAYTSVSQGTVASQTGTRVLHMRVASDGTLAIRRGATAAVTSANASASYTASRLTLGADRADTPTLFIDCTMRAVLVAIGATVDTSTLINEWARQVHGATL